MSDDITGHIFGRLTVLNLAKRTVRGCEYWHCRCECGADYLARRSNLTSGHNRSCGCFMRGTYSFGDTTEECWRNIPSYPLFEVSSLGRVRRKRDGRVVRSRVHANGYIAVTLQDVVEEPDRRRAHCHVHVLVCEAFHGPRPHKHDAAHEDGVRANNIPANLTWKTRAANFADEERHGTLRHGENHHCAKLTEADVINIRRAVTRGTRPHILAERYGVSSSTIVDIRKRRSWRRLEETATS